MQQHKLGFWSIVLLGINGIIGSGIFLLPQRVARLVGNRSFLVILFDALLVLSIALCFAQAATYFKEDGGAFLYAKTAFGDFVGFEVGFMTWAICIIAQATMGAALATELKTLLPTTISHPKLIVALLIIILALLNIGGVKVSKILINCSSLAKLIPLLLFIIVGIFFIHKTNWQLAEANPQQLSHNFASAAVTMFYACTGFESMVLAAGEMRQVQKNLPRAIIMVIGCVTGIYLLIQVVATGILGSQLPKIAVPLQAAARQVAGPWGQALMASGTLLSMLGLLITSSFVTPRAAVALAATGSLPHCLNWRNRHQAPVVAIIIGTALTLIITWQGSFNLLAQISAVSRFAQYLPTCLAVLVFAKTKSLTAQQFKLKGGPCIPLLAIGVSCWLLTQVPHRQLWLGLGALILGIPLYTCMKIYRRWQARTK